MYICCLTLRFCKYYSLTVSKYTSVNMYSVRHYTTCFSLSSDGVAAREAKLARIVHPDNLKDRYMKYEFQVGPAMFGPNLGENQFQVSAQLVEVDPQSPGLEYDDGCSGYSDELANDFKGKILLVNRGGCLFVAKVCVCTCTLYLVDWILLTYIVSHMYCTSTVPKYASFKFAS